MLKFLCQYSLLIQIKIKLVCFYYPYLQHPQNFKSRTATALFISILFYLLNVNIPRKAFNPVRPILDDISARWTKKTASLLQQSSDKLAQEVTTEQNKTFPFFHSKS